MLNCAKQASFYKGWVPVPVVDIGSTSKPKGNRSKAQVGKQKEMSGWKISNKALEYHIDKYSESGPCQTGMFLARVASIWLKMLQGILLPW